MLTTTSSRAKVLQLATTAAIAATLAACGIRTTEFGSEGGGGQAGGAAGQQGGAAGADNEGGDAAAGGEQGDGPVVRIHMRATTEPMLHADGLSGQTPIEHTSGVRSLQLFKTASDPNPLTVFDFGQDYVEVSYADGADTVIHAAPASELPEAHYTLARTVHSHVRYRVASTMHVSGMTLAGEFDNLQVLSDGTMIDGALRDHGYFEFIFVTGSSSYPWSGANAPVPEWADTGGFTVKLEQGEWAYYYPVDLPVTANIAEDMDIVLEVNMHESFRWQDESHPGFAAGQFDTTPLSFEPVKRFGASSYELYLE